MHRIIKHYTLKCCAGMTLSLSFHKFVNGNSIHAVFVSADH